LFCKEKIVPFRPKKIIFSAISLQRKIKIVLLAGESDDSLPGVGQRSSKLITFAGP
jgi:hypothetical protein